MVGVQFTPRLEFCLPGKHISFNEFCKSLETAFFFFFFFFFCLFERTKHQPRLHLRSYLVLQILCSEAVLSQGIDAFWH